MTTNSYELVPPFPLYLNVENAENTARKHFEKTNKNLMEILFDIVSGHEPWQDMLQILKLHEHVHMDIIHAHEMAFRYKAYLIKWREAYVLL